MNPTALDIIRKHTLKPDADYSDSWVLAAMREIYELGWRDGCMRTVFNGLPGHTDAPNLHEKLKELFPEK